MDPQTQSAPQQQPPAQAAQPRYVEMPDGSYAEWPQGVSAEDFRSHYKLPAPDTRNSLQKGFDDLTTPKGGNDPVTNGLEKFGAATMRGAGNLFVHPIESAKSLAGTGANLMDPTGTLAHAMGQPNIPETIKQMVTHPIETAGEGVGGAVLGMGTEAGIGAGKAGLGMAKELGNGYKSPVIDPALQNASKVATAIRPPNGIPHAFESDIASELPKIKGFAQQAGNPMHSQWEAGQAARQSAEQGLQHYRENILGPNKEAMIPMAENPPSQGFVGPRTNPSFMTLESIENRLGEINDMMRPSSGAKTAGAAMTALERQGLEGEANMLRQRLYSELGQRTGIEPESIKGMRESYGKQFGIADTIDAARRARLGPKGASAEGATIPTNKGSLVQSLVPDTLKEYLANRNFRNAAKAFEPQTPEYPQPQYPQRFGGDQFNNPNLRQAFAAPTKQRVPVWKSIEGK